jgi:Holliday junction resolvasome RuvABC ATP-dependent DNA helicase subunit
VTKRERKKPDMKNTTVTLNEVIATAKSASKLAPSVRTSKNRAKYFGRYIGQNALIADMCETIDALKENANLPLPKWMLDGIAGAGKTELANAIAKALAPEGFTFVVIHESITLPQFLTVWAESIEGKKCVIFIDEVHGMKNNKVINLIKRLTETGGEIRSIRADESTFCTSNPFQHLWIAASNMETTDDALWGASGRFDRKTLVPLSEDEVKACLEQMAGDMHVTLHKDTINYLAGYVMANPRAVRHLCEDVARKTLKPSIDLASAKEIVRRTNRYPGGLLQQDLNILKASVKGGEHGLQVGVIAHSINGMDPKVCAVRIRQLEGIGLMKTTTGGKKALSVVGGEYLKKLVELAKAAKARQAAKAEKGKKKGADTTGAGVKEVKKDEKETAAVNAGK